MPYSLMAFLAVVLFALVHLFAGKLKKYGYVFQSRFLSAGGGIAIAYVFIDLLPKLSESDVLVKQALKGIFPYFERHVYIMALVGFLLFFTVDRTPGFMKKKFGYWHRFLPKALRQTSDGLYAWVLASYSLFNFTVAYSVVDRNDLEVQPLALFSLAMALHYFTNDYTLNKDHGSEYQQRGKWILIGSLFLGWLVGLIVVLPPVAVALVSAFIAGGVIMNVIRHELPKENPHSLSAFLVSAAAYTLLLLFIGAR